jgi:[protein-PII] uridylyltransferase
MHELRFLGKYIPEFGALTALVQHELYHTYTVDEHSLFALEKLEHLIGRHYPQEYFYSQLFQEIQRPEILYFSLLLHDIGKAMGPGHVKRGSRSVPSIAVRMGLSREETQTVEFLIENHLVMGHLSQRRDIHDPKLIGELARTVGDEEHLRMLALVTYCDTNAVGPGVWNEWKDTLLKELFAKTREYLLSGLKGDVDKALKSLPDNYLLSTPQPKVIEHISMIQRLEEEGVVLEWAHPASLGYTELNLCTYDSDTPGLFSRIAGVLASRGINILGARIFTSREGVVIDCVHVEPPDEKKRSDPAFWGQISEDIYSVIERTGRVETMLVVHEPPSYLKKKKGYKIPPRVHVDNSISDTFTVIDVYAEDRIGLLYSITSCLADQGVYIHSSKITTEADKVIDAFYVTDIFGHKITEKGKLQLIKNALLEALNTPEINGKTD